MEDNLTPESTKLVANSLYEELFEYNDLTADFEILSTIRYDPNLSSNIPNNPQDISEANFFLFKEHYNRLKDTSEFFLQNESQSLDISESLLLNHLKQSIADSNLDITRPLKIRLLASLSGNIKIELYETSPRPNLLDGITTDKIPTPEIWDAYIDNKSILISPFTSFKTTNRGHYTDARNRCLPGNRPGKEEVLVFNTQSMLMEGSITNVAIKHKPTGKWITPPLSSGCLCGVMRHYLLMNNYIKELPISKEMVNTGDELLLFNGIMGVVKAKVVY